MREIVLDTETTGFDPSSGDRIVEIGCVELENHLPTENNFHVYLNPERDMPAEAFKVHGLSSEFLADKPLFADICDDFLKYIGDAPLIIHNASFDMKFLNAELTRLGREALPFSRAIDSIEIAKRKLPGARYSLDELCKRFSIDLSRRSKHGALLDAELTALVYFELIGGRQQNLALAPGAIAAQTFVEPEVIMHERPRTLSLRLTDAELQAHKAFIAKELGKEPVWAKYTGE